MYTIEREGQKITLTNEEVRSICKNEHMLDIHYEVESAVNLCEEDGEISFANYEETDFSDVTDEDSYRSTFIDYVTDSILEREEMYDHDPNGYTATDYTNYVLDCAEEIGIRKE